MFGFFFSASPALKSCSGGVKVKYTIGALPGSSGDFMLKKKKKWTFPGDKIVTFFFNGKPQASHNRNILSKNKHIQVKFYGWMAQTIPCCRDGLRQISVGYVRIIQVFVIFFPPLQNYLLHPSICTTPTLLLNLLGLLYPHFPDFALKS